MLYSAYPHSLGASSSRLAIADGSSDLIRTGSNTADMGSGTYTDNLGHQITPFLHDTDLAAIIMRGISRYLLPHNHILHGFLVKFIPKIKALIRALILYLECSIQTFHLHQHSAQFLLQHVHHTTSLSGCLHYLTQDQTALQLPLR